MRVARRLLSVVALALVVACGSETVNEPGTLALALSGSPAAATNAAAVQLTGQVTRTPADADQTIVVTVTGGPNAVSDTASASGQFTVSVTLNPNTQNNLSVGAADGSGATAEPVTVSILHDNRPPQISSMIPAPGSDAVTAGTIQLVFGEPVAAGSPNVLVTRYGVDLPGSVALSPDGLTLTFTPTDAFAANAVHVVNVTSARDTLGNILLTAGGCFVTGGGGLMVFADTGALYQTAPPPAGLVAPDLLQLRLARTTTSLYAVLQFSTPRTLDPSAGNNTSLWIDLDVDQSGGTGFVPYKDYIFSTVLPASGAGSEFFIEMGTLLNVPDLAFVAQYVTQDTAQAQLTYTGVTTLAPTDCGLVLGFAVPFSALGLDDGAFNMTLYADAFADGVALIDPAPDEGIYAVTLTAASVRAAPGAAPPVAGARIGTMRRPVPIRRR